MVNIDKIDWQKVDGMLPVIVQDNLSAQVLMLGYMNIDALNTTLELGKVTFFSRTKQRLWTKGETSGDFLEVKSMVVDCDNDTLLIQANPVGPTCHLGNVSCFDDIDAQGFLGKLETVIASRQGDDPKSSYTASLFDRGTKRIAQKVGEEGVECALAATVNDTDELVNEASDLMYHLLVLLKAQGLSMQDVLANLEQRHNK
ncbi:bifunctional phosphoribosyl-AMP cyclohydrolase/phosphoribosyl-ATP diphosphatase HisIE [Paraferrimonas sp. SM1919]|uniref:bifunctional phosphoribosyl-AMP cyclohydrolase/phosphoribosyl-ATP diphosphatase HisIE n=1 Tax=Paraferrimonas sp. SM1919 TaxID=2662263 RepID=UPI0013D6779D|nr:bifunctional phosphoribosyl-AMP cyclohydrolase/phosphoribosyl-ATP diphosphatase HisIE [Paraferrimonas sp. SM1919]